MQASQGVGHGALVLVLYVVPALLALTVEPWLFVLADRRPRRWFVAGGVAGMAVAAVVAAWAPTPVVLGAAVALSTVASGCGVELAQATLADAHPDARERALARWTLFGAAGDLAAPAAIAVAAGLGGDHRAALAAMGAVLAVWAVALARAPFPPPSAPSPDDPPSDWATVRAALAERGLFGWLLATVLCDLLDEILVLFAALHLRDQLGASVPERSVVLGAGIAGGIVSLALLDRVLARVDARRVLLCSAVACAAAFGVWLSAPTWGWSAVAFACVGASAAPLYPLAMAQAYAVLPGRSGAVHAAARLFVPIDLGLPLLLAAVADAAGTRAATALLVAGPAGIAVIAGVAVARSRRARPVE